MRGRWLVQLASAGISLFLSLAAQAQTWRPIGPQGGDVRSLTAAPDDAQVLFLGTSDGHVFGSRDGGEHWGLLGRIGAAQDDVVMALVVDSRDHQVVYAGTWTLSNRGGAVYRSKDGGHTWQAIGLAGETVRALAQAPTNPDLFIVGTISGIHRSRDSGRTWERISPSNHEDLRNFDSVAIDPRNAEVIYAGTYHLAWKTENGGRTWVPVHAGMHDDSDVMSLGIDSKNSAHIVASACSGAYQSENGGMLWTKFHGIGPHAYRTQLIRLDPQNSREVYAGTTSGLWRTLDGGASWKLLTPTNWSIAALVIDPKNTDRLVIGTDRNGVQISEDGGKTYHVGNEGFYHRQVMDLAVDPEHADRALVVLTNSVDPVLATRDGGRTWIPLGPGLDTVRLRRVYAAADTWLASLSSGGLLRYDEAKRTWVSVAVAARATPAPIVPRPPSKAKLSVAAMKKTRAARPAKPLPSRNPIVNDLAFCRDAWLAATDEGLYASPDRGASWTQVPSMAKQSVRAVRMAPEDGTVLVAAPAGFGASHDGGKTWTWSPAPFPQQGQLRMQLVDGHTVVVATERGLYLSGDAGASWTQPNLPDLSIRDTAELGDAFLVSTERRGLYLSTDRGKSWEHVSNAIAEGYFPVLASRAGNAPNSSIWVASSTEGLYALQVDARAQVSSLTPAANPAAAAKAAPARSPNRPNDNPR